MVDELEQQQHELGELAHDIYGRTGSWEYALVQQVARGAPVMDAGALEALRAVLALVEDGDENGDELEDETKRCPWCGRPPKSEPTG